MRGYLVKTYNQLHYSLFNRVVSTSGTQIVIGKGNWLYEKPYLEKLNMPAKDDGRRINKQAKGLRVLQDRLADIGIGFIFVIAPSKAAVYPEHIPDEHLNPSLSKDAETDYDQAIKALQQNGVNFVDSHTLFIKEKNQKEYQLFGPSGTHWNKYGAYLVWKKIAETIQEQVSPTLQIPSLAGIEKRSSDAIDADLGGLLNLWDTTFTSPVTYYPVFKQQQERKEKPAILLVGDSFLFTLVDIIKRANLSDDVDAWYYFKRHFHYPAQDGQLLDLTAAIETPMKKNAIDWQRQFFDKDLIVLVETQQWLPNVGFGFVRRALEAIKQQADNAIQK